MTDIQPIVNKLITIFNATENALNEWNGTGNLQFPLLFNMIANNMSWDDKQIREADPIIRFYIRHNPNWYITRGAKGGIMKISDKQKKEQLKSAKDVAKQQVQDLLNAKLASLAPYQQSDHAANEADEADEIDDEITHE